MARQHVKVAVIGASVAGLVTAGELQREGHEVVVYEKSDRIGGLWVYDSRVESDPLGVDPDREIIHSILYNSLRINLTTQLMEFTDYPFTIEENKGKKAYFPPHEEVLKFLNNFARDFGLGKLIRFNCEVVNVEKLKDDHWIVESTTCGGIKSMELFQAVVVCNGHNTIPKLANPPGIKKWPGKQIHSHNYRDPEPYREKVVVVIGFGPSGAIAIEIAEVAKEVHISTRSSEVRKLETFDNVWQHTEVKCCYENGKIAFKDGAFIAADIIIHCTGYKYDFPFLNTKGMVTVDDNRVDPLYKHVFPPQFAPAISFVGIPKRTVTFRMMELQAKWVAQILSGKATLPSKEKMLADVKEHYRLMDENGVPKRHTHTLPLGVDTFIYLDWLASQVGLPPAEQQLKDLHAFIVEKLMISKASKQRNDRRDLGSIKTRDINN